MSGIKYVMLVCDADPCEETIDTGAHTLSDARKYASFMEWEYDSRPNVKSDFCPKHARV